MQAAGKPLPKPEENSQDVLGNVIEPWGAIWERKWVAGEGQPFRCVTWMSLWKGTNLTRDFWARWCNLLPNGAAFVKVDMVGRVDYFKPVPGSSLCEMLMSNRQHLWSSDGEDWVLPPYSEDPALLGGSEKLNSSNNATGSDAKREPLPFALPPAERVYLHSWGHSTLPGGCAPPGEINASAASLGCGKDLFISFCGQPPKDMGKLLDIFMQKLSLPWQGYHPVGNWANGLPYNLLAQLDWSAFTWEPPIQRRWAVVPNRAFGYSAQCLDIEATHNAPLPPAKSEPIAISCCGDRGIAHRILCDASLNWTQANAHCSGLNMRLCTVAELERPPTVPGNCLSDHRFHWSLEECAAPFRCAAETLRVMGNEVANLEFWQGKCKVFPAGTEFVRLVMGGSVEYFKPTHGHSLCDMFCSRTKHLWSRDGFNWFQPPYSAFEGHLGGSAPGWFKAVDKGLGGTFVYDRRKTITFWGQESGAGGCCQKHLSQSTAVEWGHTFSVAACAAATSDAVSSAAVPQGTCPHQKALVGTSSAKRIRDSAITASSYLPPEGRHGAGQMWRVRMDNEFRSWLPAKNDAKQWVQWDFGRPMLVSAVLVRGRKNNFEHLRTFLLSYAAGNEQWNTIPEVFAGPQENDVLAETAISPPIIAERIRLHALTWRRMITLRAEFLGCELPSRSGPFLGPECQGDDCSSAVQCPAGQWPLVCQTEPLDSGDGAYVDGNATCRAFGTNGTRVQAWLLCSPEETVSVSGHGQFQDNAIVTAACEGADAVSCNCVTKWGVDRMCGGEVEFRPSAGVCRKAVPRNGAGRRRYREEGTGAKLFALCPTQKAPTQKTPAPVEPPAKAGITPRIEALSPALNSNAHADRVLKDDGDNIGKIWLGTHGATSGWFLLDLGEEKELSGFELRNTLNTPWHDRWTENFTIQASTDKRKGALAVQGSLPKTRDLIRVDWAATAVRYINFTFTSAGVFGGGLAYFAAVGPESSNDCGSSSLSCRLRSANSSACIAPSWWCSGDELRSESYSEEDCDGDGVPDPHCTDGKHSGFLGSASDCSDSWPRGGCRRSCQKPLGWCAGATQSYTELDCDYDGIPDPYCQDITGKSGVILSKSNCQNTWPTGRCSPGVCVRPQGFCIEPTQELQLLDCDFDGIPDFFCRDRSGVGGYISSKVGCMSTWPLGACRGMCKRPRGWCAGPHQQYSDAKDHDGDGIPDPFCVDLWQPNSILTSLLQGGDYGNHSGGFLSSRNSCINTKRVGGKCLVPPDWCTHPAGVYSEMDCDGDGIPDAHCEDPGGTGFISSAYDCVQTYPLGGCQIWLGVETRLLSMMQCQRNGVSCRCKSPWCSVKGVAVKRVDVDKDSVPDFRFTVNGTKGFSTDAGGLILSGRRCLDSFPNNDPVLSTRMWLLTMVKDLQCNLWQPSEIIFLVCCCVACLFAYGVCECPTRARKRL